MTHYECTCIQRHLSPLAKEIGHVTVSDHMLGCGVMEVAGELEHAYGFSEVIAARNQHDENLLKLPKVINFINPFGSRFLI